MLPETARPICTENPVLRLLMTQTGSPENDLKLRAGYLLKNIIKYKGLVRYDQHIKEFLKKYIDPTTRENPKEVVLSALTYLFNRFDSRTYETMQYLIEQRLLDAIFPLDDSSYAFFNERFNLADAHRISEPLSAPAFLGRLFIAAIIGPQQVSKVDLINRLEALITQVNSWILLPSALPFNGLERLFQSTIAILKILPENEIGIYYMSQASDATKQQGPRLPYVEFCKQQIIQAWRYSPDLLGMRNEESDRYKTRLREQPRTETGLIRQGSTTSAPSMQLRSAPVFAQGFFSSASTSSATTTTSHATTTTTKQEFNP